MYRWKSLSGSYVEKNNNIVFNGGTLALDDGNQIASIGEFICDQRFSGGTISGKVKFDTISDRSTCHFILNFQPSTKTYFQPRASEGLECFRYALGILKLGTYMIILDLEKILNLGRITILMSN